MTYDSDGPVRVNGRTIVIDKDGVMTAHIEVLGETRRIDNPFHELPEVGDTVVMFWQGADIWRAMKVVERVASVGSR